MNGDMSKSARLENSNQWEASYFLKGEEKEKISLHEYEETAVSRFFSSETAKLVQNIKDIRVSDFRFCSILDNSLINPWVHIFALNGSIAKVNPAVNTFIRMIDSAAQKYFDGLNEYNFDKDSIHRFSCYTAVSGRSAYLSVSEEPLLIELNPTNYFPFLSVNSVDITSKDDSDVMKRKPHYKIAYLVLAHKNKENVIEMIRHLYSQDAIIMIHIDGKYPEMLNEVRSHVRKVFKQNESIHFVERPFKLSWGSPYIVMAQLEGYFQLLDLAEWDYAINLSADDFPLMSTAAIHKKLEENPGKSYIEYWRQDYETVERLAAVLFPLSTHKQILVDNQQRYFYRLNKYPPHKQHQWMILSREFIQILRTSKQTYDLLAFMEFTMIPDEAFFIMVALCPDLKYKDKIISDTKRYIYFQDGQKHPLSLRDGDENLLVKDGKQYFFVRKVDVLKERQLVKWMLDRKRKIDHEMGISSD